MRLAGRIEDGNCPVTIELNFEYPIRRIERLLRAVRLHRGNEVREILLFRHADKSDVRGRRQKRCHYFSEPPGEVVAVDENGITRFQLLLENPLRSRGS
jgi:hypothetical protein